MALLGPYPLLLLLRLAWAAWLSAACAYAVADTRHTVKPGETLISICQQAADGPCDWRQVQRLNAVADPLRLVPGQVLVLPAPPPREETMRVDLVHAHGQVSLERGGAAPVPLRGGAQLRTGDTVRTGPKSSASMRLPDGSRLVLHANSVVLIERHTTSRESTGPTSRQDTQLNLQQGTLDSLVAPPPAGQPKPRLQIRTNVANLGVRGTVFRTRATANLMVLEVLEGEVQAQAAGSATLSRPAGTDSASFAPGGALSVGGGMGLVANEAGLGPVRTLPAAPLLLSLPVLVQHFPLVFDFSGTAPAKRWRARISAPGASEQPLLEAEFSTPIARWPDSLPDGTYELRVRAADDSGLEGADAVSSFVLKARPLAPVLLLPESGATSTSAGTSAAGAATTVPASTAASVAGGVAGPRLGTARMAWQAEPEAATYQLQVADEPSFSNPRLQRRSLNDTALEISLPQGRHFWRVASVRADGSAGPWSESQMLQVQPAPAPPPPPAPAPDRSWWLLLLPLLLWLL